MLLCYSSRAESKIPVKLSSSALLKSSRRPPENNSKDLEIFDHDDVDDAPEGIILVP